jgi:hypothetical protein
MKIYSKLVPAVARDIAKALIEAGDIEVETENLKAAQQDFAAVLNEYLRQEKELSDATKDVLASRGWSSAQYGKAKRLAAGTRGVPLGDDAVDYVIDQMLEYMLISPNLEEVYAEDHVMRKRIVTIIRKYLKINEEVDQEVRGRMKHLQEGTRDWEITYRKTLEQIQRARGLI